MEAPLKFDVTLPVSRNTGEGEGYDDVFNLVCKVKTDWSPGQLEAKVRDKPVQ